MMWLESECLWAVVCPKDRQKTEPFTKVKMNACKHVGLLDASVESRVQLEQSSDVGDSGWSELMKSIKG